MTMVSFFILGGIGLLLGLVSIFQNERTFFKMFFMLRRYGYRMSFGTDAVFRRVLYTREKKTVKEEIRFIYMGSRIIWASIFIMDADGLFHYEDFIGLDEKSFKERLLEFEKSKEMDKASNSSLIDRLPYMNDRLRDDVLSIQEE